MLASVLRGLLRATLKSRNKAGRPITDQRRWLNAVTRVVVAPRAANFESAEVGGVAGEWVTGHATGSAMPAILYLHGGAYCIGSPGTHRALTGHLALRCSARIFAADYRLAPENPFPAAVEDAVAAYEGLLSAGCTPDRLAIAGDSAGGGLRIATTLRLRERGLPLPSKLVVFSPWADLSLAGLGPAPPGEVMLNRDWLEECARFYCQDTDARNPLVSPVYADLGGLPPTLIQVGADELILSDSERLAEGITAAGGDVRLSVFPRRWHVFQLHAGVLVDSDRALDEVAVFLSS